MSKPKNEEWNDSNCHKCTERSNCFYGDKKIFAEREKQIDRLGFCEEYVIDATKQKVRRRQAYEEEVTFSELFNRGIFPIYKGE